jgi:hypothetical protein
MRIESGQKQRQPTDNNPGQQHRDAPQPGAGGGTQSAHPETIKPGEAGQNPTKHADRSQTDARTGNDRDGNAEQQRTQPKR